MPWRANRTSAGWEGSGRRSRRRIWTFFVATLTIAGVPGLAAFFSKDAIKAAVFHAEFEAIPWMPKLLYAVALFTAGLTAFYMFRLLGLTFWGRFRGTPEEESRIHESPRSMTVPLIVLAVLSVVSGWIGIPIVHGGNRIGEFLKSIRLPIVGLSEKEHHASLSIEFALMGAAVAVAAIGMYLAYTWYVKGEGRTPAKLAAEWPGVYKTVSNKYYVDEAYDRVFVRGLALGGRQPPVGGGCDGRRPHPERRERDHEGSFVDRGRPSISTSSTGS